MYNWSQPGLSGLIHQVRHGRRVVCEGEAGPHRVVHIEDAVGGGPAVWVVADKGPPGLVYVRQERSVLLHPKLPFSNNSLRDRVCRINAV